MRKITSEAQYAFLNRENYMKSNTQVKQHDEVSASLYLHGSEIAWMDSNGIYISACGYFTNTTKERLNGLLGITIQQKNFEWFVNDEPWDGSALRIGE